MTKHALARFYARVAGRLKRRGAERRRKAWLAEQHRKAIKIALALKEKI